MDNDVAVKSPLVKEKREGFFVRNIFIVVSFLVPLFLMLFAFMKLKVYPFGDQQILIIDAWHQYFPFLNELRNKLVSGDSLFYSWNIGGGANFLAIIGYYAASPLYLLSVLCPKEYLTEFMAGVTLIKIAFSGLTFAIFLKSTYKKDDFSVVAFSTLYALSAFAMGYYWTLMWLDGMALLPLIILGLNKLMDEGKYKLFTFSLAIALIANYYIGAFICMFVALYYIVAYISKYKVTDWRRLTKITGRVLLFSAIGVGLALFIVLPVFFALKHASAATNEFPKDVTFYKPWLDMVNDLFTGIGPNKKEMTGSINMGCGMIAVILVFLYAICNKIKAKEKAAHLIFLVFIFVSFNINTLDYILHGFHFPNELPHRYAFIFSFFLLAVGYKAYINLKDIKPVYIGLVMAGIVGYALIANKIYDEGFDAQTALISIFFTVAYSVSFIIFTKSKKEYKDLLLSALVVVIALGEGVIFSQRAVIEAGSSGRDAYRVGKSETEEIVANLYHNDSGFYRLENTDTYTINQGAFYSYRGLSQFNSSCNSRSTELMSSLGIAGNGPSNRYTYHYQTPIFNSLFNLKYIINRNGTTESEYLTFKQNKGDVNLYEYKYPLPLGIVTTPNIRAWNKNIGNPFETQNSLMQYISGYTDSDILFEVQKTDEYSENMTLSDNGSGYSYTQSDLNVQPYVELTYTAQKKGTTYAYVETSRAVDRQINITIEGKDGTVKSTKIYDMAYPYAVEIGYCDKGDVIKISFSLEAAQSGIFSSNVYMCDTKAFEKAYNMLADETLNVTSFNSDTIKGTVDAHQNSVLYTSIFYEEGWSAKVDGKKTEIKPIQDALISIDIPAGTHTVEFSYKPQGFVAGLIVSIISLLFMIFLIVMGFLKKRVPIMDTLLSNEVKTPKIPDLSEVEVRDLGDLPEGFEIDISDAVSDESGETDETEYKEVIEIIEIEDADEVIPKTEDAESEPQGETKE